jgi:hypothetical protein
MADIPPNLLPAFQLTIWKLELTKGAGYALRMVLPGVVPSFERQRQCRIVALSQEV